jgi:hypothetical protein
MSQSDTPIRYFRVRVVAASYALVQGRTKKEAVENARRGDFIREPRPEWSAQISDLREVER